MRVKFAALVAEARGTLAGTTFAGNKHGAYAAPSRVYRTPRTAAQNSQTATFRAVAALWPGLTDAQRAGWNAWAQERTIRGFHGHESAPSGCQAFIKQSVLRAGLGLPPLLSAPEALPKIRSVSIDSVQAEARAGDPTKSRLIVTLGAVEPDHALQWWASGPLSAGRSGPRKGELRQILIVAAGAPFAGDILPAYRAAFGEPQPGNKIALRLTPIQTQGFRAGGDVRTVLVAAG